MADPKNSKKKGGSRYYEVEGFSVPSVTTVLDCLPKPALPRWAAKVAAEWAVENVNEWAEPAHPRGIGVPYWEDAVRLIKSAPFKQRDKKADLGTAVHEALEAYLKGVPADDLLNRLGTEEVGYFYGLMDFLDAVSPEVISVESTVFSKVYGYAGTADIIAVVDGVQTIIDAKTSKDVYTSHGAQIAAYARAELIVVNDKLEPFRGAEQGIVVCVNPDGGFKAVKFDDLDPWFDLFKAAQEVWVHQGLKVPRAMT